MTDHQTVTIEQLARLYQARNDANKRMSQAMRSKDATLIRLATQEASNFNKAYDAGRKQFKQQQKSANRTAKIRFYLNALENIHEPEIQALAS